MFGPWKSSSIVQQARHLGLGILKASQAVEPGSGLLYNNKGSRPITEAQEVGPDPWVKSCR